MEGYFLHHRKKVTCSHRERTVKKACPVKLNCGAVIHRATAVDKKLAKKAWSYPVPGGFSF